MAPVGCERCDRTNNFDGWELTCGCSCHIGKPNIREIDNIRADLSVEESKKVRYTVRVDDNYHYMDESERYTLGEYETCEQAIRECKQIVNDFLSSSYKAGMTTYELYQGYVMFGEDPFISSGDENCKFSAWTYAKEQCEEICS